MAVSCSDKPAHSPVVRACGCGAVCACWGDKGAGRWVFGHTFLGLDAIMSEPASEAASAGWRQIVPRCVGSTAEQ